MLSPEEQKDPKGQKLFQAGKEQMMLATRQYARRQKKWICQRFLRGDRECPPIYGLDSTQPALWGSQVYQPAVDLLQTWIDGKDLSRFSALQLPPNSRAYSYQESRQMFFCDVCNLHLKVRAKIIIFSPKKSHFQNSLFHKIHIVEISFFRNMTFSENSFFAKFTFSRSKIHKSHIFKITFFTKKISLSK